MQTLCVPFQSGVTLIFVSYSWVWLSFIFTDDSFEVLTPKWCEPRKQCFDYIFSAMIISRIELVLKLIFLPGCRNTPIIAQQVLPIKLFLCSIFVFVEFSFPLRKLNCSPICLCTQCDYKCVNIYWKVYQPYGIYSLRLCFYVWV